MSSACQTRDRLGSQAPDQQPQAHQHLVRPCSGEEQPLPDAHTVCSNFLHNCCNNLEGKLAAVLNAAAILICALVWLWLDELVDDVLQPAVHERVRSGIIVEHTVSATFASAPPKGAAQAPVHMLHIGKLTILAICIAQSSSRVHGQEAHLASQLNAGID